MEHSVVKVNSNNRLVLNTAAPKQQPRFDRCNHWLSEKLRPTEMKWTQQARWCNRVFDFWNGKLGLAVEVDGPDFNERIEAERDAASWFLSGIAVVHVRSFNEADAAAFLKFLPHCDEWYGRRRALGFVGKKGERTSFTRVDYFGDVWRFENQPAISEKFLEAVRFPLQQSLL